MFEKFKNNNKRYESRITITKSMSFGFPTKFFNDNDLVQFKYVVLYYDLEAAEIGFQFTNSEEEKYKFTLFGSGKKGGGYGGNIVARSFFKNYNIDTKKYHGRYDVEKEQVEGIGEMFVIKLSDKKVADITDSQEVQQPI